jgi:hypothetical protein
MLLRTKIFVRNIFRFSKHKEKRQFFRLDFPLNQLYQKKNEIDYLLGQSYVYSFQVIGKKCTKRI